MPITSYTKAQIDTLLSGLSTGLLSKYVPFQPTAPDSSKATVWVDTSTIPQVLKGWTGSTWAILASGSSSGGAVSSVAGRSGAVILTKTDVGLANVDNTSDVNKPISAATAASLALRAPLASPPLTGIPTAPTASVGTNTTQVATTAFVALALSLIPARTLTSSSYTFAIGDVGGALEATSSLASTFTVPSSSSVVWQVGSTIEVFQAGTGQITLAPGSGVTLQTPSSLSTRVQYSTLSLRYRGGDVWAVAGDLA